MAFNMAALRGQTQRTESVGSGLLNSSSKELNEKAGFDVQWIRIDQIHPNPNNRYHISDEEVENMVVSIRNFGLRQNLEVKKIDDYNYMLITGEKRYRALSKLNAQGEIGDTVPCLIRNFDTIKLPLTEEEKEVLAINETNATQRDYTDADIMYEIESLDHIYQKLRAMGVEDFEGRRIKGIRSRQIIAEQLGMSTGNVQKFQRVSKNGSEELKQEIEKGNVSINVAEKIAALPEEEQKNLIMNIKEEGREDIQPHDIDRYNMIKQETRSTKKKTTDPKINHHQYNIAGTLYTDKPGAYTLTKHELMDDIKSVCKQIDPEKGFIVDEKKYFQYKKLIKNLKKMFS